jgi:23S rRNA pseudouridine2605 synthase
MPEERLQKILSRAGVASRRKAEQLILSGSVTVNGAVVVELGSKADLERDHVKVNGRLLRPPRRLVYLALNKPADCVTTTHDPEGRRTVMELLRHVHGRVYPVGRLDYHSEGLLLLTNDGDFANALMRRKDRVPKTYMVKINGRLTGEQEKQFRRGIRIEGRMTAPAGLRLVKAAENPWYEVVLAEGRQNQIRLMFQHLGRLVEKLRRTKIAFLELGSLKPGELRRLTPAEVERFRRLLGLLK